jgi:hypothetical protein
MEATIFTAWIYDHLKPHAAAVKVAHPLMLRAIAVAKKKNDRIDARKIADCLRCDFLPECYMASTEIRDYRNLLVRQAVAKGGNNEPQGWHQWLPPSWENGAELVNGKSPEPDPTWPCTHFGNKCIMKACLSRLGRESDCAENPKAIRGQPQRQQGSEGR